MAGEAKPEITAAIVRGAVAEFILMAVGVVLYLATDQVFWIFVTVAAGTAVMLLLLAQAGAFTRKDERR